jgi:hypothetical protein
MSVWIVCLIVSIFVPFVVPALLQARQKQSRALTDARIAHATRLLRSDEDVPALTMVDSASDNR